MSDALGTHDWPPSYRQQRVTPFELFARESSLSGLAVQRAWMALPEERRVAYRMQHEDTRRAAWEQHRTNKPENTSVRRPL